MRVVAVFYHLWYATEHALRVMAFDGVVVNAIVKELSAELTGGKVDKIYQPHKDEIVMLIRRMGIARKIVLSASPSSSRVHITAAERENPQTPPLFCMLMRKHVSGGTIKAISQFNFDRVIKIDVESFNELGDLTLKSIIIEIMGKHSNIILIDDNNKIYDAIRHVDYTTSSKRIVLPALIYEPPPPQEGKYNPLTVDTETIIKVFSEYSENKSDSDGMNTPDTLYNVLIKNFYGISPTVARQVLSKVTEIENAILITMDLFKRIKAGEFNPSISFIKGKPKEFSAFTLKDGDVCMYPSMSEAVDMFYAEKDRIERLAQRAYDITKVLSNNITRCRKKIKLHSDNLIKASGRDQYRIYGDLITANIYRMSYGDKLLECENYYTNEMVKIPLNELLSPSKNAQRYYKLYNKAKQMEIYSTKQLAEAEEELLYLESVLQSVQNARDTSDISEIRDELIQEKYIKLQGIKKKKKVISMPIKYISSDGFEILVGKNNRQNDLLTLKTAFSTDIWLHTKNIPGSHVIIKTEGNKDVPERTLIEAAQLAAYYSKANQSLKVPVDYTVVKNVKKPNGAKPGMVIYDFYNTILAEPDIIHLMPNE